MFGPRGIWLKFMQITNLKVVSYARTIYFLEVFTHKLSDIIKKKYYTYKHVRMLYNHFLHMQYTVVYCSIHTVVYCSILQYAIIVSILRSILQILRSILRSILTTHSPAYYGHAATWSILTRFSPRRKMFQNFFRLVSIIKGTSGL